MESWGPDPSIGFVSTYPPTLCAHANFTASLVGVISENRGAGDGLGVVALANGASTIPVGDVVSRHEHGNSLVLTWGLIGPFKGPETSIEAPGWDSSCRMTFLSPRVTG